MKLVHLREIRCTDIRPDVVPDSIVAFTLRWCPLQSVSVHEGETVTEASLVMRTNEGKHILTVVDDRSVFNGLTVTFGQASPKNNRPSTPTGDGSEVSGASGYSDSGG